MCSVKFDAIFELVKPGVLDDRFFLLILFAVLIDNMREGEKQITIIVLVLLVSDKVPSLYMPTITYVAVMTDIERLLTSTKKATAHVSALKSARAFASANRSAGLYPLRQAR